MVCTNLIRFALIIYAYTYLKQVLDVTTLSDHVSTNNSVARYDSMYIVDAVIIVPLDVLVSFAPSADTMFSSNSDHSCGHDIHIT